ncbi:MFS transporter [Lentzea sp. CA-135723]|uniref:MFS transporter n=1 Tax=Lentzea sp. CA-135723 TaxID=3239950 RepID=UPI003D933EB8
MTAVEEGVAETPLRRNREFRLLWIGQALSDFGSAMAGLALPLVLLAAGYGPAEAGLIGTVVLVVGMIVRVPSGYLADRYDSRALMLVSDLARLGVVAVAAVWLLAGTLPLWVALLVVVVSAVALEAFRPAQNKVVRRVVPADQLGHAVSLNQARMYGASIAAPAVAGVLIALAPWIPFAANAVTFAVSAWCIFLLARTPAQAAPATREKFWPEVSAGLRFVVGDRFLRLSSVYFALLNLIFSALSYALILGAATQPGGATAVGLAMSSAAVAGLVGSLLVPYAAKRLSLRVVLMAGPVLGAALLVVAWSGGGTVPFVAAFSALCLLTPLIGAVLATIMAKAVPEDVYGRVTAASSFASQLLQPFGPWVAGIVLAQLTFSATAGLFAVCLGALALIALLVPTPSH